MQQYNPNARYRFYPFTLRSLLLNLHALLRQAVKRPPQGDVRQYDVQAEPGCDKGNG